MYDEQHAAAVCELGDGRVAYASPDAIRFVDIEKEVRYNACNSHRWRLS